MGGTSADFPKFVNHRCDLSHELRKVIGTSNFMILVPLFHLTGLKKSQVAQARQMGGTSY